MSASDHQPREQPLMIRRWNQRQRATIRCAGRAIDGPPVKIDAIMFMPLTLTIRMRNKSVARPTETIGTMSKLQTRKVGELWNQED